MKKIYIKNKISIKIKFFDIFLYKKTSKPNRSSTKSYGDWRA